MVKYAKIKIPEMIYVLFIYYFALHCFMSFYSILLDYFYIHGDLLVIKSFLLKVELGLDLTKVYLFSI